MKFHRFLPGSICAAATLAVASTLSSRAASPEPIPDADNGGLALPPGFRALIVADNLVADKKTGRDSERLRGIAVAPNGDIYAKLVHGNILAMRDTDGDGRVDVIKEFGPGDGGTHILFHDGWLYHSSRTAVYRYKYIPGELVPSGELQTIVKNLPAEKDHDAKAFAFDESGHMIVEVGSPYNVYSQPDRQFGAKGMDATEFQKTYGGFWEFDANKLDQTQADGTRFSTGHRHSLALARQPISKQYFMVMMGRDNMNIVAPDYYDALDNAERVSEEMHRLTRGVNIGWPYTYWDPIKKARMIAPEFGGDNRKRAEVGKYDEPVIAFPAHWAPLQMAFYRGTQFPAHYHNGAFISFHGSWNRAPQPQDGFKVVFVPFDDQGAPLDTYEEFAHASSEPKFRMGGVAIGPDGSLYLGETDKGRIWRVIYTGETSTVPATTAARTPSASAVTVPLDPALKRGQETYAQYCAACHMADGSGAGQMNPPLAGSAVVAGSATQLIDVVLRGPTAVLPADRAKFANSMPPFPLLRDGQIADILTYARARLVQPATSSITAADVAKRRALLR
ncbi:MAG TPA: c-type cytochrome [Lacunisphaera sp.]|jgi:glucose/arabinose dehydrogenase